MIKIQRQTKLASALCAAGLGLLAAGGVAHAETTFKLSGYGTLAATFTDDNVYEFRSSMSQSQGATNKADLGVLSKLGLQGVANFGNGLSVTGQLLGQRRRIDSTLTSNNDFDAGFEWLFAQYSPTSNLDFRVGRVVLPSFMISDSRNVGFTQPWLMAPLEVYARMPLTTVDGAQAVWRIPVGSAIVSIQPTVGSGHINISSSGLTSNEDSKKIRGLNASLEYGDWMMRLGQVRSESYFTLSPSLPGFILKDVFTSVGLQYDNGKAVLMSEWTMRKENNTPSTFFLVPGEPLTGAKSWYVAGGWRFGKLLPMLIYADYHDKKGLHPADQHTRSISTSLRYDISDTVALKAQVGQYFAKDGGMFVNPAAYNDNKKIVVGSVGIDFVF
ncbi:MAG: porin [Pseudomonadota bacterium]